MRARALRISMNLPDLKQPKIVEKAGGWAQTQEEGEEEEEEGGSSLGPKSWLVIFSSHKNTTLLIFSPSIDFSQGLLGGRMYVCMYIDRSIDR
jgi:hypothetical protein